MATSNVKKVQANVDRQVANDAESIMNEIGVTPSVVINTLYREIVATGRIPLSFSLTSRQKATLDLQDAIKNVPTKQVTTDEDLKEFFDED